MAQRLPTPGQDDGTWGDILNAYLEVSHNNDGTLANDTVGTNQIQNNAVTNAQLDSPTQTSLGKANSSLQSSQLGAASGVATLDGSSQLTNSQLPSSVVSASSQALGNLGATPTLTLTTKATQATGTLTANCALTVSGLSAGCAVVLLLTQDGTGGRTLTVNGTTVPINATAGSFSEVQLSSPDGSTLYIAPVNVGALSVNGKLPVGGAISLAATDVGAIALTDLPAITTGATREYWRMHALGLHGQAWPYDNVNTGSVPVDSTGYFSLTGFLQGDVVTNIAVGVHGLAAGTAPTGIYLGLFDKTGTALATTANVASSSLWKTTRLIATFAISAPYTILSSDGYYLAFVKVGVFGTTDLNLALGSSATELTTNPISGFVAATRAQAGRTDLSTNATLGASSVNYWMGWS